MNKFIWVFARLIKPIIGFGVYLIEVKVPSPPRFGGIEVSLIVIAGFPA